MHRPLLQPLPPLRVYSPFGVVLEGRSWSAESGYRYGFQAQEQDTELWEGAVNYKYRVEDPRLGRYFSVDPLFGKYPYYSVYQFSGNRLIDCVELEGLEPSKNHDIASQDSDFKAAAADVCIINDACQSANAQTNGAKYTRLEDGLFIQGSPTENTVSGAINSKTENGTTYVTDTDYDSAEEANMWVHYSGTFLVDESQAVGCPNYNLFITTALLNDFACGTGQENYVFPMDGIISSSLKEASIVQDAFKYMQDNNLNSLQQQFSFGGDDLAANLAKYGTPFNIEGLLGSGAITMIRNGDNVYVTIFNVTSLTSGAAVSKLPLVDNFIDPSTSNVRDPNQNNTYFGNISQTYSFTIPLR